jgi:hypothetical protein
VCDDALTNSITWNHCATICTHELDAQHVQGNTEVRKLRLKLKGGYNELMADLTRVFGMLLGLFRTVKNLVEKMEIRKLERFAHTNEDSEVFLRTVALIEI